jgi:hypothetical protein
MMMMQAVLRVQQALSLIMGVGILLGRHRRRGMVPEADGGEGAGDKASAGLGMAPPAGAKPSHIDFGGGSAEAKKAKQKSKERRKHKNGRQGIRTGTLTLAGLSSERPPWLRSVKSSEMEAPGVTPSLRRRMRSLWSSPQ